MSRKNKKKNGQKQNNQQDEQNKTQKSNEQKESKSIIPDGLKQKYEGLPEKIKNSIPSINQLEPLFKHLENDDIKKGWYDFLKIIKNTEQEEKKLEQKQTLLEQEKAKLKEQEETLKSEKDNLENAKKETENKSKEFDKELQKTIEIRTKLLNNEVNSGIGMLDKITLDKYEKQLKEIKIDAENRIQELIREHQKLIGLQKDKESELQKEHSELEQKSSEKKKELEGNYFKRKENLEKEYSDKKEKLEARDISQNDKLEQEQAKLKEKERELKNKENELNWDEEGVEEEKDQIKKELNAKYAQNLESLKLFINELENRIISKDEHIEEIQAKIRALGDRNPETIVTELEGLKKEKYQLQSQLNNNMEATEKERLVLLEQEKTDWLPKINSLETEIAKYKAEEHLFNLQVSEIQTYKEQVEFAESSKKILEAAAEELRNEVDDLTKKSEDKRVFDACSQMDENEEMQTAFKPQSEEIKLNKQFTETIQQTIVNVNTDVELYYSDKVLRKFIAGMAMSRLTILQGISGTGKTSLPMAFAKAINGGYSVIEAQSGWRDRQDLIGYYNTFEKKFYEGQFLKALYEAQTEQYKNRPYFIIIDEMNLSHPEHYFADILSIMEKSKGEQDLFIAQNVKDLPNGFQQTEKGITLRIPENVWFIGTANHDETTLQFAPKTYDRANVMELPINIDKFSFDKNIKPQFLPYKELNKFISKKNEENSLIKIINSKDFKNACAELGLGWGNRLEKQVSYFASAHEALGGNKFDAADHIITSKILRSLKGRYDLNKEALENLKKVLIDKLEYEDIESIKLIDNEIKRLDS